MTNYQGFLKTLVTSLIFAAFLVSLWPSFIYSIPSSQTDQYIPWFTGPLLAPTPVNMQPGHPAIEPSVTISKTYGKYKADWQFVRQPSIWAINPLVDFQFGITNRLGIELLASCITNLKGKLASTHLQDTTVLFGFQASNDDRSSWIPDCRLFIQETFPSGKYQKLNPKKEGIDSTGQGSYQTGPAIAFRKLFTLFHHPFSLRWSIGYLFPAPVKVQGYNTYGGGIGTKGTVRPGQTLTAFLSGEHSINQNWVFAFDTEFLYQKKSRFSGRRGVTASNDPATVELPSSIQISFAPEIEYNFTPHSGLLAGIWATLAGKNADAFASAFLAYVYMF